MSYTCHCVCVEKDGEILSLCGAHVAHMKVLEQKAFENGAAMLANEANVSFGTTAKIDIDKLWSEYNG